MTYKKQDIVLVPFPFNDKPGFKKRSAITYPAPHIQQHTELP